VLRVAIVDDEALARRGMRRLLGGYKQLEIVGEAASLKTAMELIRAERPDALFLDIEMHGGSGFDLLQDLQERPDVVFVTAHDRYAVKAYDFSVLDYLLKPIDPERLAEAVTKLEKARASRQALLRSQAPALRLRTNTRTLIQRVDCIAAMRAEGDYTRVFVANSPAILVGQSLGRFEAQVPTPPFLRINRSLIVNTHRIREIETVDRDTMHISLDGCAEAFVVGRATAARIRKLYPGPTTT
jgi:two-component system, LytTR family, response regulator